MFLSESKQFSSGFSKDHFTLNEPQVTEKPLSLRCNLSVFGWNTIDDAKFERVRLA